MLKKLCDIIVIITLLCVPLHALELPIGSPAGLSLKLEHNVDEPYGKGLPLGPASVRFFEQSIWVSDTLTVRMVEFSTDGVFKRAINMVASPAVALGDFCIKKNAALKNEFWVCDADNPYLFVFDENGKMISKLGTYKGREFGFPWQIESLPYGGVIVFDRGTQELIEVDKNLKIVKRTKAFGKTMLLVSNQLNYMTLENKRLVLNRKNLKTRYIKKYLLSISPDSEPELLAYDKGNSVFFGIATFPENENARYQIVRFPINPKYIASIAIPYPTPFAVRPLVRDKSGEFHSYFLDTSNEKKPVLRLEPISLDSSIRNSSG